MRIVGKKDSQVVVLVEVDGDDECHGGSLEEVESQVEFDVALRVHQWYRRRLIS